jgi:RimJ/RimL family protein N-acetyltransferase
MRTKERRFWITVQRWLAMSIKLVMLLALGGAPMTGYFGTESQRRLQAQAEASAALINETPGLCQAGRIMACDEPDRLGWKRIDAFLERDGVFGFRLIPANKVDAIKSELMKRNFRLDTWDVFAADRTAAQAAAQAILSQGLPEGLSDLPMPTNPNDEYTGHIQALMGAAGIVPFSGSLLTGALGPAVTAAVGDKDGNVVAAAHGYLPHNMHSIYHRHAWGGLAAVAEAQRGKGIGTYINARMIVSVFRDLGATHVHEFVSESNIPSRRMVEACGLRHEPALACGMATPIESARYTR